MHTNPRRVTALATALIAALIAALMIGPSSTAAPSGSTVTSVKLTAWPSVAYLSRHVTVGWKVPARTITATTDLTTLPASEFREANGKVTILEDDTLSSGTVTSHALSIGTPTVASDRAVVLPAVARTNGAQQPSCVQGYGCTTCETYYLDYEYDQRQQVFMNEYSYPGAPAYVTETTASEQTLGIGSAYTGGGWSADGTVTTSTKIGGGSNISYDDHEQLSNRVNYGHYMQYCSNGLSVHYYHHLSYPNGFYSLQSDTRLLAGGTYDGYKYCQYYNRGAEGPSNYWKNKGSNITFSEGVAAPFLSLTSTAAYSGSTEIEWKVNAPTYICGSQSNGWVYSANAASGPYTPCGGGAAHVDAVPTVTARLNRPTC